NFGRISPGLSIGILTINGNYTQDPGGEYFVELSPTDNDQLVVTGTTSLDGTLTVSLMPGTYFAGTTYDIIESASGISGDFATFNFPAQPEFSTSIVEGGTIYRLTTLTDLFFFSLQALNRNARSVERYINTLSITKDSELADFITAFPTTSSEA